MRSSRHCRSRDRLPSRRQSVPPGALWLLRGHDVNSRVNGRVYHRRRARVKRDPAPRGTNEGGYRTAGRKILTREPDILLQTTPSQHDTLFVPLQKKKPCFSMPGRHADVMRAFRGESHATPIAGMKCNVFKGLKVVRVLKIRRGAASSRFCPTASLLSRPASAGGAGKSRFGRTPRREAPESQASSRTAGGAEREGEKRRVGQHDRRSRAPAGRTPEPRGRDRTKGKEGKEVAPWCPDEHS